MCRQEDGRSVSGTYKQYSQCSVEENEFPGFHDDDPEMNGVLEVDPLELSPHGPGYTFHHLDTSHTLDTLDKPITKLTQTLDKHSL